MKKSLSILVTLVLVLAILTGCSSSKKVSLINENPAECEFEALGYYYYAMDLQAKVLEAKKTTEPYTKGNQIFSYGEKLIQNGMYSEAVAPLKQAVKFYKGINDEKAPAFANNEYAAKGLLFRCLDLQGKIAEADKAQEKYTKGLSIFSAGKACIDKGMYTEAVEPLKQTNKFWSSLVK